MDKPRVTICPADAHNYKSRKGARVTTIILHATQGWRAGTIARFQDQHGGASCHFLVCMDGAIVQSVQEEYAAEHAGNWDYNKHSIGIEIEALVQDPKTKAWLEPPKGFTEEQYKSLLELCKYLVAEYEVEPKHVGRDEPRCIAFRAHSDVPDPHHPGHFGGISGHVDPGPHFPWWEQLMKDLQPPATG